MLMSSNSSVDYYELHSEEFIRSSINADLSVLYGRFEALIPDGCYILDLGCGSGRDSKHFLDKGYSVLSADPSEEMCKQTALLTNNDVVLLKAENMKYVDSFDAVWACASLLHVAKNDTEDVINRVLVSLKHGGIFYASWKYGDNERKLDDGRFYNDYTEESLKELFNKFEEAIVIDMWLTTDVRAEFTTKWINVLVKRV